MFTGWFQNKRVLANLGVSFRPGFPFILTGISRGLRIKPPHAGIHFNS